jgi:SAM-dependent methyltransferase
LIKRCFPDDRDVEILDVGCGHGALIHFARELGYKNLYGIDKSPEQVAAARRLGIEGVQIGDLRQTLANRAGSSLDAIVAYDVIEHFTREELLPIVDDVRRVLKPGGRWIIHVPNGESPFAGRVLYGDLTHELAFTRTSLTQLLLSSGFDNVECFEDAPVVHGAKSAVRWATWKAIRSLLRLYIAAETGDTRDESIFSQNLLAVTYKSAIKESTRSQ